MPTPLAGGVGGDSGYDLCRFIVRVPSRARERPDQMKAWLDRCPAVPRPWPPRPEPERTAGGGPAGTRLRSNFKHDGYLGFGGQMDLSIVIRTVVVKGDRVYLQVGGGIVYDSDNEAEHQETLHKAEALFRALDASPQAAAGV